MKTRIIFLLLFFACFSSSFAYNNLYVSNPQRWSSYNGVIKEAELSVRPMGAFVEYQLTLDITGRAPMNEPNGSFMEIVMDFDLPINTMITDSWLWIEGVPKQADILDRWTASAIYEAIVSRRKDPSLLVKNGTNQYRINVYPMKLDESRKFKITYLSPARYMGDDLVVEIPSNILTLSNPKLEKISTYILPSEYYSAPSSNNEGISFSTYNHPDLGECTKADVAYSKFNTHGIVLKPNSSEDIQVSKFGSNDEGYYQLSFVPSDLMNISSQSKKICYLIDYDKNYSPLELADLLNKVANNIKSTLTDNDYFNVAFSKLAPELTFDEWTAATDANVDLAFSSPEISLYSNMVSLLGKGLDFMNNKESGSLVLVSNNVKYDNIQSANALIYDIQKLNKNNANIHIIDYNTNHYTYTWTNGNSYYNNGYFFTNLARKNGGEYISFYNSYNYSNLNALLEEAFDLVTGENFSFVDIYTSNENGICYGRMNVSNSLSSSFNVNKTIHHLGKYSGGFPTNLEIACEVNNEVYHYKTDLSKYTINVNDSVVETIWNGLDIAQLEKEDNSNQVINEIIYLSLQHRILSNYTAFLCVEEEVSCENCEDPQDNEFPDGEAIGVDEQDINKGVSIYPNPFTTALKIELESTQQLMELKIYNAAGQCIKTFTLVADQDSYLWDGTDDNNNKINAGIYILKAVYANKVVTKKLIKQ